MFTRNEINNINEYQSYMPYEYDYNNRFVGSGVLAPLLVGGVFGYALGGNKNNNQSGIIYPIYYNPCPYSNINPYYNTYPYPYINNSFNKK